MPITELRLPVDVPWKRMGVSQDMIDQAVGDLKFPDKWRSSLAVFYHEPTELPPEYCNRRITYIKIVATLTNYQISGEDVTVLDELRKKYNEFHAWRNFESRVTDSYPCYGALMQVSVLPNPKAGVPLHDYPYITSIQPRKREMYEVVTESGELASQSGTKLNVLKGSTTTESQEEYDLDLGGGGHSGLFGLWSVQGGQKQQGTVDRYQHQKQDVTTVDASREKREAHAFSTSLNQIYSLLQGYHLGTNRTVFFLQPRPHIQDSHFTFIRGLRRLEGIQEFFLIVDRPASVPGICLEIALETAHIYAQRAYRPRLIPAGDLKVPGNLERTAGALGLNVNDYPYYRDLVSAWNGHLPWIRHNIQKAERDPSSTYPPYLWAMIQNGQVTEDSYARMATVVGLLPELGIENVGLIFDEYEALSGWFFVTGRKLCVCVRSTRADADEEEADCEESRPDHISTCGRFPGILVAMPFDYARIKLDLSVTASLALVQNMVLQDLNAALSASLAARERAPYDELRFLDAEFMLDEMTQLLRLLKTGGIQDRPLGDHETLRRLKDRGLAVNTVLELSTVGTSAVAESLQVEPLEAQKLRRETLVAALEALDPGTLRPDLERVNPAVEAFRHRFPDQLLQHLTQSSTVHVGAPDKGQPIHGLPRLLKRAMRFLTG
jgi:hypothetical protein